DTSKEEKPADFVPLPLGPAEDTKTGKADEGAAKVKKEDAKSMATAAQAAQPADWRESWGKPQDHVSKTSGKVGLPQAKGEGPDPLLKEPDVGGHPAKDEKIAPAVAESNTGNGKTGSGSDTAAAPGPVVVEPQPPMEKKPRTLMEALRS